MASDWLTFPKHRPIILNGAASEKRGGTKLIKKNVCLPSQSTYKITDAVYCSGIAGWTDNDDSSYKALV